MVLTNLSRALRPVCPSNKVGYYSVRVLIIPSLEIPTQRDRQPMRKREGFLEFVVSQDVRGLRMLFLTVGVGFEWILAVTVLFWLECSSEAYFCLYCFPLDSKLKPYSRNCSQYLGWWLGGFVRIGVREGASWTC